MKNQRGVTLISLIVMRIVLLILAGISINGIVVDNGVKVKENWSVYVHEYESVNDQKEIYVMEVEKSLNKNRKQLDSENPDDFAVLKEIYPIKGEKIELSDSRIEKTLIDTIEKIDGLERVALYEVNFEKINVNVKKEYLINLKTGTIYSIQGEYYKNKIWHIPRLGV